MATDSQMRSVLGRIVEIVERDGKRGDSDAATQDDLDKYDEIVAELVAGGLLPPVKATPARVDADKTAKPLTRLIGHARAGDCVGPGSVPADAIEDTGTKERTSLRHSHEDVVE